MDDNALYSTLLYVHSFGRWVLLILLLVAIVKSATAGNAIFSINDQRLGTFLTIVADIMLLVGIYLYFVGPWGYRQIESVGIGEAMKNPVSRFFGVEHLFGMLIAIILIHVGKAQGKKSKSHRTKHKRTLIFYFLALVIILVSIPWPFRSVGDGRGWF